MSNPIIPPPSNKPPRDIAETLRTLPRATRSAGPGTTPPAPSNLWQNVNSARANLPQESSTDWDPLWRPVQHGLNVITSAGVGVINTLDKGIKSMTSMNPEDQKNYILGSIPVVEGFYNAYRFAKGEETVGARSDFQKGFNASISNNMESENYVWGSDLIENATDAFGARFDPNYVDREDNVNPWLKAGAGFVLDVGLDPLTYIPGGVIASGVKGSYRAAQAARGLAKIPASIKGVVKGTPSADLKFGKWSGAVKPVGYEQWLANRSVQKIDRIAAKNRIRPEQAMWASTRNLTREGLNADDVATYLNKEAEDVFATAADEAALATAQKNYRSDWTGESVTALGKEIDTYSKNVEDFFESRRLQGQSTRYQRQYAKSSTQGGASAYRNLSKEGKEAYNQKIYDEQMVRVAGENAQVAFYAGIKSVSEMADEASDPLLQKVRETLGNSATTKEAAETAAQTAMKYVDDMYNADPGTTEAFVRTQRDGIVGTDNDFQVSGLPGSQYAFSDLVNVFLDGKQIGLAPQEANIFGRTMAEFMALAHDVRPTKAPEPAGARVAEEIVSEVQEPLEVAVRAPETPSTAQVLPDVAAESVVLPDAPTAMVGTVKMLWDEATTLANEAEVRRLNKTVNALDREIDDIYEVADRASNYMVNGKKRWLPATKGTLVKAMQRGEIEAVIDTRPLPYTTGGNLTHLDKTFLKPDLKKAGVAYHTIGEVVPDVPRNPAIHLTGNPTYAAITGDASFEQGIDAIVEQLNGARKVAILVFEGAAAYNKRQTIVAQALRGRGISATVILQRGAPQSRQALDLIAEPLIKQSDAAQGLLSSLLRQAGEMSIEEGTQVSNTVFRASANRQLQAAQKIMTEGDRDAWVGNIQGLLVRNSQGYASVAEEIVARSNILTNMIVSHQNEAKNVVKEMLAAGGAKGGNQLDVEMFFKSVFGSDVPVAESFSKVAGVLDEVEYEISDPDVVFKIIRVLANLQTEIPGYTDTARALLTQIESYKKAVNKYGATTLGEEIFDEVSWVRRTYAPAFRENPGAHINIFGEVVEGGDSAVAAEMDRVVEAIGRSMIADASAPPLVVNDEVASVLVQVAGAAADFASANAHGANTPVLRNVLSTKYGAPQGAATSTKATTRQVEGTGAGRGTAQGDAKDAAMRADSDAAIVETSPKAGKQSSSATTLAELGAPQGDMAGKTIMLARNGELSGQPLTEATEKAVSDAAQQGAKFVVGDMPKVDSAFHDLLNKLDAEYVIYHTGGTPRTGALAPAAAAATDVPVQQRWLVGKDVDAKDDALRAELSTPWKSPELNDIYDHVAGFARTPIGSLSSYVHALNRVSFSTHPMRFQTREILKSMGIPAEKVSGELLNATQEAALTANQAARKAYEKYKAAFKFGDGDDGGYGTDILGRMFRDVTPQNVGSAKTPYSGIKDPKDKYFGDKLYKLALKFEETVGGVARVNLTDFKAALVERYGYVRAEEIMPFVRKIESERVAKQGTEMVGKIEDNMTATMSPEQIARFAEDPLTAPKSPLEKVPDNIRSGLIVSHMSPAISNVRSAVYNADSMRLLDYVAERSQVSHVRYKLSKRVLRYTGEEQGRIIGELANPLVVKRILGLVEGGQVVTTAQSTIREALGDGAGAAAQGSKKPFKDFFSARQDFIERWFGGEGKTVGEEIGGKLARREKGGNASIRETMDLVRAEDMSDEFWLKLGGDSIVKWSPLEDPKVDDFVYGVSRLLGIDPETSRPIIQEALMNAANRTGGGMADFQTSHLLEELATGIRNATKNVEVDLSRAETVDIVVNGRPLDKGDSLVVSKVKEAARVNNGQELIDLLERNNPWIRVDKKSFDEATAIIASVPYARATAVPQHIRSKNVQGIFDAKAQKMAASAEAFNNLVVPNGKAITERAAQLKTEGIDAYIASLVQRSAANLARIKNDFMRNEIINTSNDYIKSALKKMQDRGERMYTQWEELNGYTRMRNAINKKISAKPGSIESWNAQMMGQANAQATLRAAGVFQTTGLYGKNFVHKINLDADHNWAYIDFMDTYRALARTGADVDAVLREGLELYTIGGKSFPTSLIPEMGVLAAKLSQAKLGPQEKTLMLYDYVKTRLGDTAEYKPWADALDPVNGEGFADSFVSYLVSRLAKDDVGAQLFETHLNNGAAALRVADTNARQIMKPIFDELMQVRQAIPRKFGDRVDLIDKSTDTLRAALAKRGFGRTSAESLVSSHMLQKFLVDNFDTIDINGARHKNRMDRAVRIGKNSSEELTDKQVAALQDLAATRKKRAMPDEMRLQNIRKAANQERAKLAEESMPAAREMAVADVASRAARAIEAGDEEGLQIAYEQAINISEQILSVNMMMQAAFKGNREAFEILEAATLSQPVRETAEEALKATPKADRLDLASQADQGRGARVHQAVSGRGGQQDVKPMMAGVENALDGQNNIGEKVVEGATRGIQKILGDKTGEATTAWTNRLIRATFGKNRYDMLADESNADLVSYGYDLIKAWSVIFDTTDNGLIARSGLDTDQINKYIARGPMGFKTGLGDALTGIEEGAKGIVRFARLPSKYNGYEITKMLPDYIDNLLDPEMGARSALQAFKGLNYGLHHAAQIPEIGAQFSAEFGHRAFGFLTVKDALAAGFKQINTGKGAGTLAEWLDPYQAYPPEMIRQMANAERFLNILDRNPLQGNKIIRATDKITSFIKSSLTVWRPGHHVVSAGGDALMNLLDGVVNPYRYYQAVRIMRSNGQLKQGTFVGRDAEASYGKFMGSFEDFADAGKKGVEVRVGGKTRRISDEALYKLIDDSGGLINNNTAEDLLAIGDEISVSGGRLSKIFKPIVRANRGLGEFSARRDNVLRLAHAVDIISKRSFASVNDMRDVVLRELVEWHPTLQSLSGMERVYGRRIFFFYTWMRNAANKVFETIVEDPRYLTVIPKLNYELSTIGGDPQGIGQPMPNDPRLPEFASRNILGPHWYDENGNITGITVNSPQLDIFQELLGKIAVDPNQSFSANAKENAAMLYRENTIGMFSPIPTLAIQSMTGEEYKEYGMVPIQDPLEHIQDMTGIGILSRATGRSLINENGFLAPRTDIEENPAEQASKQLRTGLNAITGAKWTEWSQWYSTAKRERSARQNRQLEELRAKLLENQ
jgi:hypothetical protein